MNKTWTWTFAAWLGAACAGFAQTGEAAGSASEMLTLAELMRMGGWLMYVLAALSVLGLALIVYYAMVLRTRNIAPTAQALRLRELLKERRGRDARELCAQQPTALAAVAAAGLDFLKENPGAKPGMLKEIMESEGGRQAGRGSGQSGQGPDPGLANLHPAVRRRAAGHPYPPGLRGHPPRRHRAAL